MIFSISASRISDNPRLCCAQAPGADSTSESTMVADRAAFETAASDMRLSHFRFSDKQPASLDAIIETTAGFERDIPPAEPQAWIPAGFEIRDRTWRRQRGAAVGCLALLLAGCGSGQEAARRVSDVATVFAGAAVADEPRAAQVGRELLE